MPNFPKVPKGMSPSSNPNRRRGAQPQPMIPNPQSLPSSRGDVGKGPGGGRVSSPFPGPKGAKGGAGITSTAGNAGPQPRIPTTAMASPQPMQAPKYDQSSPAPLTRKQRGLVREAAGATRDVYGAKVARKVKRSLKRGIRAEGMQRREPVSKRLAFRSIKKVATRKEARGWRKAYKRSEG